MKETNPGYVPEGKSRDLWEEQLHDKYQSVISAEYFQCLHHLSGESSVGCGAGQALPAKPLTMGSRHDVSTNAFPG
jgi:hypothetical protein